MNLLWLLELDEGGVSFVVENLDTNDISIYTYMYIVHIHMHTQNEILKLHCTNYEGLWSMVSYTHVTAGLRGP